MLQMLLGFSLSSPGSGYVLFLLSTLVYVYVGKPLLEGLLRDVRTRNLGMMALIIVAISAAYFYILAMVFDILPWEGFLGACHPGRYHAPVPPGCDEIGPGSLRDFKGAGKHYARHRPT
jgi:hypothetical protein